MLADVLVSGTLGQCQAHPVRGLGRRVLLDLIISAHSVVLALTGSQRISGKRLERSCQIADRMRNAHAVGGGCGRNLLVLVRRTVGVGGAYPI